MKLATYAFDDGVRIGIVDDGSIVDSGLAEPLMDMIDAPGLERLSAAAAKGEHKPFAPERLLAPIPHPPLFLGVGLNYRDHAKEVGRDLETTSAVFSKPSNSVAAPFADVASHHTSFDYEGELGVVIGHRCYRATAAAAAGYIAGYVIVNDLSVRELLNPHSLILGKGGVGHAPFGPWLTTADEIADPHALSILTSVSGEVRQSSNTHEMHRNLWQLIAWLSQSLALEPGTIVATGSPGGTGASFEPPRWLVPGDVVRVEIAGLGAIENRVVAP